jgi:formate dehydrogenase major subunit/formate dehydrogenase alpha subunit
LNEENYLLNKLARQKLGTNNIDCAEHVQRASVVAGMDAALGLHAPTNTLADVAGTAQAVLLIGTNTSEQHPLFGVRLRLAALQRGCRLVVAHPDFINMAEYAALRLVHRPGAEPALVGGLLRAILDRGWEDREFIERYTTGFEAFRHSLDGFTLERAAAAAGVTAADLQRAAEILATCRPSAVIWGGDLASHTAGPQAIAALANLQLVLGNLGVAGGGLVPLRAHANSQGASDMGGHPLFFPGYQRADSGTVRKKFEAAWGKGLPSRPGLTGAEMAAAAGEGRLRALFILSDDLTAGAPEGPRARHGLQNCDFIVMLAATESETARQADVLLPGVTFAEKTGTFTSAERRIQLVRQAIDPQGAARPDWQVIAEIARRIPRNGVNGEHGAWVYASTAQVMAEIAALTPSYAGVSHERLTHTGSLHWPVKNLSHPGTPILSVEHCTGGRGQFIPLALAQEQTAARLAVGQK